MSVHLSVHFWVKSGKREQRAAIVSEKKKDRFSVEKQPFRLKKLAGSTGFEPAVSALTGQRVKPGYTTTPKIRSATIPNSKRRKNLGRVGFEPTTLRV